MRKKSTFLYFLSGAILLFALLPLRESQARIIIGPHCSAFENDRANVFFSDYQSYDYDVNGLLQLHLKLVNNGIYNDGRTWDTFVTLYDDLCNSVHLFLGFDNISLPLGAINFSLRFFTPTHFKLWNDDLNQAVECSICDVDFSSSNFGDNLKISFGGVMFREGEDIFDPDTGELISGDQSSFLFSGTFFIVNPNQTSKRTPVLIVPGILGTDLIKGGEKLWLDLGRNLNDIGDEFMDPIKFNENLTSYDSSVITGNVIRLATTTIVTERKFDYTNSLIKEFQSQNYAEGAGSDATLFTFPYDWRYGVSGFFSDGKTNVDALKQKIADIRAQTGSDKVDIIAHSTGGLLVKKYVMDNPTDNHIGKAVFVGVPNLGAPKAVKTLLQGDNFGIPFLSDAEMKKISANLPVSYELFPSEKYVADNGSYITVNNGLFFGPTEKDLDFNQTKDYLIGLGLNLQAFSNVQNLHSASFDNFDMLNDGVDLYSIVGCKSGTLGKLQESRGASKNTSPYIPDDITGDGTVPMASANSLLVNDAKVFYVQKPDHGKMLSADGIRQKIVNIIAGSALNIGDKIITKSVLDSDPSKCELNGHWFGLFSPVSIAITDQNGNHTGIAKDGSIENNIAGADYQVMGEHKFVFLPTDENQTYSVNLKGTGNGTFTFKDQQIVQGQAGQTETFINIPVTTSGSGRVNLGTSGGATTLSFDSTGGGNIQTILPSAILNAAQSQDVLAPISTSTISGVTSGGGLYQSDVIITLSATDPIIVGQESSTSGLLETKYNLDNAGYQTYSTSTPLLVSTEATHTLKFFSTDKAGNNELEQTLVFTIDKTAPLISVISPTTKDYLRSETITINATSTDVGSGVFSFGLGFDGKPTKSGDKVDLFYEKLGSHFFTATSTDFMNNFATSSVNFRIVATPESTISDIERAYSLGWIKDKKTKETLVKRINAMVKLENRIEKIESRDKNGKKITKLIERIEKRIDKVLAQALKLELKLYNRSKIINDQGHNLLQEDIQWLIDNN